MIKLEYVKCQLTCGIYYFNSYVLFGYLLSEYDKKNSQKTTQNAQCVIDNAQFLEEKKFSCRVRVHCCFNTLESTSVVNKYR